MRRVRERLRGPEDGPDQWAHLLADANIPERYQRARVDALTPGSAVRTWLESATNAAQDWMGTGRSFYLHGPFESGKSSAAAIIAADAVARCECVLWLPVRDVPAVRFREDDRAKRLNTRLSSTDLLILDDLGSERFKHDGAAGSALEETIRIMYDRERSVIITSNVRWESFPDTYARIPPLVSVVQRMATPIEICNTQWAAART